MSDQRCHDWGSFNLGEEYATTLTWHLQNNCMHYLALIREYLRLRFHWKHDFLDLLIRYGDRRCHRIVSIFQTSLMKKLLPALFLKKPWYPHFEILAEALIHNNIFIRR
jgi:hypothetical protein